MTRRDLRDFSSLPHTRARGAAAEEAAESYLRSLGYRIVERNVASKLGEIDLVAMDGETICFVEVKARATAEFGLAIEAVGPRKQQRLARAASMFLAKNRSKRACRFDVLGLDRGADGSWRFTLVRDAFQLA
ncbi:MAG TPA: YraN family protein [Thermoanaerobaculia bacterium]|nr:YraN family protein [Thermoanaerobaculia bacterium]